MHNTAIRHGLLAAFVLTVVMSIFYFGFRPLFLSDVGEIIGSATIVIAMMMVYFGIKRYRDKELNGQISFGQAFGLGVYVAAIGSFLYGIFEGVFYGVTDSREIYWNFYTEKIRNSGQSPEVIQQQLQEMQEQFAMWDSGFMMGLFTFLTVFAIGLIIALASAVILRKKPEKVVT